MTKPRISEQIVGDRTHKAIEIGFKTLREDWNEYELEDGTIVRMKTIVGKIYHVLDDNDAPAMLPDGDPFVIVRSMNTIAVTKGGG